MLIKSLICLIVVSAISSSYALNVSQCHNIDEPIPGLTDRVKVGNCKKPPCRLRKNASIRVEMNFTADEDVEKLTNSIQAYISGVPFPFPGYDQTDACKNIYIKDRDHPAGCPLKKGQDYLYSTDIDVLQIYPRLKIVVHWALTKPNGKDLICFECPARITN
ncbi:hypothetical protein Zmor_021255 [Zophobas morio]|uniref:MD-2-related lipid-recognition domain-containing protein n=1 Tax=Zophobas morio TaxID=2755281 RepID=A0AA38I517_9CUCU|nr:hypothetical protein Zmor_021255 [Zophobas morio]